MQISSVKPWYQIFEVNLFALKEEACGSCSSTSMAHTHASALRKMPECVCVSLWQLLMDIPMMTGMSLFAKNWKLRTESREPRHGCDLGVDATSFLAVQAAMSLLSCSCAIGRNSDSSGSSQHSCQYWFFIALAGDGGSTSSSSSNSYNNNNKKRRAI